jgi:hypothetical protein
MIGIHLAQFTVSVPVIQMDTVTATMTFYLYCLSVVLAAIAFGVITLMDSINGVGFNVSRKEYMAFLVLAPLVLIGVAVLILYVRGFSKGAAKREREQVALWEAKIDASYGGHFDRPESRSCAEIRRAIEDGEMVYIDPYGDPCLGLEAEARKAIDKQGGAVRI